MSFMLWDSFRGIRYAPVSAVGPAGSLDHLSTLQDLRGAAETPHSAHTRVTVPLVRDDTLIEQELLDEGGYPVPEEQTRRRGALAKPYSLNPALADSLRDELGEIDTTATRAMLAADARRANGRLAYR
jgi:hypothetical protein